MSDGLRLNFTEVDAVKFEPLPTGWYRAKITDAEVREAGDNAKVPGAEYLNIEFTVQEGDCTGRKFWHNANFGQASLPYTKTFLLATGRYPNDIGETTIREVMDTIMGADLDVRVIEDKERDSNQAKRFRNVSESVGSASNLP